MNPFLYSKGKIHPCFVSINSWRNRKRVNQHLENLYFNKTNQQQIIFFVFIREYKSIEMFDLNIVKTLKQI